MRRAQRAARPAGFTLIELVMVVSITGLVAVAASRFIASPVQGYMDLQRRAAVTDLAQTAQARLARELRLAVPNSVRVSAGGGTVEFLRIRTAGRYRSQGPGAALDFSAASGSFDVAGGLADAAVVQALPGAGVGDCVSGAADCLVVYNTGQPGAGAWAGDTLAAVTAVSAGSVGFARDTPLPWASPAQRFYISDGPVAFVCAGSTVLRYSGHAINAVQAAVDSAAELAAAGGVGHRLAGDVSGCGFSYQPGTSTRSGLLSARLTLSRDGESVTLLQQVAVGNLP